jgi:poly-gamma-glutamate synthesis protein (capsule biosynthesis protein)
MRQRPSAGFQAFARRVIDAGADLFWGHSAHILQGIEIYRGAPIIYDAGDFVDDYAVDPTLRNDLGALFVVGVEQRGVVRLSLVPTRIERMQVNRALEPDRALIIERVTELSHPFGTQLSPALDGSAVDVLLGGSGSL